MNIFVSTWALLAAGLVFALPMLHYRVKDHTELADEAVYVSVTLMPRSPSLTFGSQCTHGLYWTREGCVGGACSKLVGCSLWSDSFSGGFLGTVRIVRCCNVLALMSSFGYDRAFYILENKSGVNIKTLRKVFGNGQKYGTPDNEEMEQIQQSVAPLEPLSSTVNLNPKNGIEQNPDKRNGNNLKKIYLKRQVSPTPPSFRQPLLLLPPTRSCRSQQPFRPQRLPSTSFSSFQMQS
jgi:hypothetical protein